MKKTRIAKRGINHWNESKYSKVPTPNTTSIKLHFEDHGQDLLWWVIDLKTEQVTDAGPFHRRIYEGKYVFVPGFIIEGDEVHYSDSPIVKMHQPLTTLKYKVTKVEYL